MLLGVAALAGNLGPALVGILDPGLNIRDRIHLCGSRILKLPGSLFVAGGREIGFHLLWICSAAQVFAALSCSAYLGIQSPVEHFAQLLVLCLPKDSVADF